MTDVDRVEATTLASALAHDDIANGSTSVSVAMDAPAATVALGALLCAFSALTVLGNLLVIGAVGREHALRTVTNYLVVSLAVADLIVGALVMPFSVVHLLAGERGWPLGEDWCDVWHSLDVLASTASILNLALISLDRYWAVTDPFAYQRRMTDTLTLTLIALVWLCSAAISFPAIAWWRVVTPPQPNQCLFTDDRTYLVLSSVISFYVPVAIILFAYYRIYVTAVRQIRCLRVGSKVMVAGCGGVGGAGRREMGGGGSETLTLRVHRGRYMPEHTQSSVVRPSSSMQDDDESHPSVPSGSTLATGRRRPRLRYADSCDESEQTMSVLLRQDSSSNNGYSVGTPSPRRPLWKSYWVGERLGRLSREHKAAKTLGFVMGVFCICWVPFFVCNLLFGLCRLACVPHADVVFPFFAWLGYINSGVNPFIYAYSMKDFRRAFIRILCCCRCCWSASPSSSISAHSCSFSSSCCCLNRRRNIDPFHL